MRRTVGVIVFLVGLALAAWIAYSLFVVRQPQLPGQSPAPGIVIAVCLIGFGFLWMRRS